MDRLEVKAAISVNDAGEITGVAWPFGTPDRVGDEITKGAFNAPARLPMLFAHEQAQAIGVWDSLAETPDGLTVKGRLLIDDVARAREVRALVREGAVTGLSIGFITRKAMPRRGGGRTITALDLHEISIVPVPSHPGARVITAKAATTEESVMDESTAAAAPDIAVLESKMGELAETVKGVDKLGERLDKLEAKLNRPAIITGERKSEDAAREMKAFDSFLRRGVERMDAQEVKTLVVGTDASGGYIAPEQFGNELLKKIVQYSPVRSYAKVITVGAAAIKYPKRLTSLSASWVGETAARSESEPTFGQMTITPHELACYVDVSQALLEDNAYDLEGELAAEFAEQFGKAEGTAFIKGTGDTNNQPVGIMASTAITNVKLTGVAADFPASDPADVIFDLFHGVPSVVAQNGVWLMNRNTLATVRKWKDSTGRYLVADPISGQPAVTLLGRPVVEMLDMDDVGAGKYPILFGDMSGYRIVDRVSLQVLRDPYTQAGSGIVRFHARKRVGADVTHADRFIKLEVAAS